MNLGILVQRFIAGKISLLLKVLELTTMLNYSVHGYYYKGKDLNVADLGFRFDGVFEEMYLPNENFVKVLFSRTETNKDKLHRKNSHLKLSKRVAAPWSGKIIEELACIVRVSLVLPHSVSDFRMRCNFKFSGRLTAVPISGYSCERTLQTKWERCTHSRSHD